MSTRPFKPLGIPRYLAEARGELAAIAQQGRSRRLRSLTPIGAGSFEVGLPDGTTAIDFSSNDYLGLRRHPEIVSAAKTAIHRYGTGAGGSRLVTGTLALHGELEADLAELHGAEAAVATATGYGANLAALYALACLPSVTFYSDELNHASIIDGLRLATRARPHQTHVYRHRDLDHIEQLLAQANRAPGQAPIPVVITDSVFSMDGDRADVARLVALVRRFGGLAVIDDAHEVFEPCSAPAGGGVLVVGTLSKRLAAQGGYLAGDRELIDLVINVARSFVFSTALAPPLAAAARAALAVASGPEGASRLTTLRSHIAAIAGPSEPDRSPIIPVVIGAEDDAVAASTALLARGLLVPAIRPPTVAPGTSRLRIALSAGHTRTQVQALRVALDDLGLLAPAAPEHHSRGATRTAS